MMSDPSKTVAVPAIVWEAMRWTAGICGAGAVGTLVVLVNHAIGFNGRLGALERDGQTLQEIKSDTMILRSSMEDVKRDVAVLKAQGVP